MDTNLIRTFIHLSETGSFSDTALQMHLTQPAVSKRIAQLEQHYNTKLFDRLGRQLVLTEQGKQLLPEAYRLIEQLNLMDKTIDGGKHDISGKLPMVVSHYIGLHKLPTLLKQFTEKHEHAKLKLTFIDSEAAANALKDFDNELALVTLSDTLTQQHPELATETLWEETLAFVVAKNHPLAQKKNIRLKDLADVTAILPDTSTHTSSLIKQQFDQAGLFLNIAMATNHFDAIKLMVSLSLGWSVLPTPLIDDSLVILKIKGIHIQRKLGLIYHRKRQMSNTVKAFVDMLTNE